MSPTIIWLCVAVGAVCAVAAPTETRSHEPIDFDLGEAAKHNSDFRSDFFLNPNSDGIVDIPPNPYPEPNYPDRSDDNSNDRDGIVFSVDRDDTGDQDDTVENVGFIAAVILFVIKLIFW